MTQPVLPYPARAATRRLLTIVAVLAAAALTGIWLVQLRDGSPFLVYHLDTDIYRLGGQALLRGENLYTQDYHSTGIDNVVLPFTYPPLAAILFAPMTLLPLTAVAWLLTLASAALLWWTVALVLDVVTARRDFRAARWWALWLLPVFLAFEPVRETLAFGQINIVLMALVATDALGRLPRWWPRGLLVGLAAAIKLTPAVFVVYFLARGRWRAAAVTVGSAVGYTLLAAAVSWQNSWEYWTATLRDPGRIGGLAYPGNQSLRGLLARLVGDPDGGGGVVWLVLVALVIVAVGVALWRLRAVGAGGAPMLVLVSLIALLCSPVSWSHHWVWLVPAVVVLAVLRSRFLAALAVLLGLCALIGPHWLLPRETAEIFEWTWWQEILGNSYVLLAVLLIVVAVVAPGRFAANPASSAG